MTIPKKDDGMRKIPGLYFYFGGAYLKNITKRNVRTLSRTLFMDQKLYVNFFNIKTKMSYYRIIKYYIKCTLP